MPQEIRGFPHHVLRKRVACFDVFQHLLSTPSNRFFLFQFTVFAHVCQTVEAIPLNITHPSVHLNRSVVFVPEKLLFVLLSPLCLTLRQSAPTPLLSFLFFSSLWKIFRDFHELPAHHPLNRWSCIPTFFLRCLCPNRRDLSAQRSLVCPFCLPPGTRQVHMAKTWAHLVAAGTLASLQTPFSFTLETCHTRHPHSGFGNSHCTLTPFF